jgi:hypothetical protein
MATMDKLRLRDALKVAMALSSDANKFFAVGVLGGGGKG